MKIESIEAINPDGEKFNWKTFAQRWIPQHLIENGYTNIKITMEEEKEFKTKTTLKSDNKTDTWDVSYFAYSNNSGSGYSTGWIIKKCNNITDTIHYVNE